MNAAALSLVPHRVIEPPPHDLPGIVGTSAAMRALAEQVRRAARTSLPVLLRGETGTGKDLVASAIHALSPRHRRPMVAINAATVTRELGPSQLFGHAAGAFTGATSARQGALREANGGTLFLDELGSLGLECQALLLRVLEDGRVSAVGADRPQHVDVRLVAATCEPIERRVQTGAFRDDLYQRLAVLVIEVPPLSKRREDIPDLASHLLATSEFRHLSLTDEALAALADADYPGNVRELRSVLYRAALGCHGTRIDTDAVARALGRPPRVAIPTRNYVVPLAVPRPRGQSVSPQDAVQLLATFNGNASGAARALRMPRTTFRDLIRRAGPLPGAREPRRCDDLTPFESRGPAAFASDCNPH